VADLLRVDRRRTGRRIGMIPAMLAAFDAIEADGASPCRPVV